jgi:hypothetical protein
MLIFVSVALLLAGCHKIQATTQINPDGSGALQVEIGFSAEERANLEKQNANSQDFCNTAQTSPNVKVTEEQRDDETWCITTTHFKNLDELRKLYGQRTGFSINRLEISNGKFYYDVDIDTLSESSSFSKLTDIQWSVVLPGEPISHNADQTDGNTLTWLPAPKSGIIHLQAESEVPRWFNLPFCSAAFIGLCVGLMYWRHHGRSLLLQ